jgi:hypothetical protein
MAGSTPWLPVTSKALSLRSRHITNQYVGNKRELHIYRLKTTQATYELSYSTNLN